MFFFDVKFLFLILGLYAVFFFFSIMKNYFHFINILLIFECFILLIFLNLNFFQEVYFLFMFCVFAACESSLGLSLMILMIRCNGSDFCSLKFLLC